MIDSVTGEIFIQAESRSQRRLAVSEQTKAIERLTSSCTEGPGTARKNTLLTDGK